MDPIWLFVAISLNCQIYLIIFIGNKITNFENIVNRENQNKKV